MSRRSHTQIFRQPRNSVAVQYFKNKETSWLLSFKDTKLKDSLNDLEIQKDAFSNVTK